jgi:hypothetical protein
LVAIYLRHISSNLLQLAHHASNGQPVFLTTSALRCATRQPNKTLLCKVLSITPSSTSDNGLVAQDQPRHNNACSKLWNKSLEHA